MAVRWRPLHVQPRLLEAAVRALWVHPRGVARGRSPAGVWEAEAGRKPATAASALLRDEGP